MSKINQKQLEAYMRAKQLEQDIKTKVQALRQELIDSYDQGVEDGPISIVIKQNHTKHFTFGGMVELVGRDQAELYREMLPGRTVTWVSVQPATCGDC